MALLDDALAELDAATNEVAARLEDLADDVAQHDADAATKIRANASRLRELAADSDTPVPPEQPQPELS